MSRARRDRFPPAPLADVAVAAAFTLWVVLVAGQIEPGTGERAVDGVAYACMVVAGGALAARRRWPLATVAAVTAALAVYVVRDHPGGPVFLALFVALYSLAGAVDRRLAFAAGAAASGTLVVVGLAAATGPGLVHLVFVGWSAAAVFLGDAVRSRRQHRAGLEERARHLQQTREEEARRRVAEERLRIARDLHDSVAHSMAVINVQAGAAAHVIDRHPDRAREALRVVQQTSGEVLDELAALLGLLRLDPGDAADRAPTPGLDQLATLVESARRAGLEVAVEVRGEVAGVAPPVTVAAYRIVQESLTNVVRHAGPGATATVTVEVEPAGALGVEIVDDGAGGRTRTAAPAGARGRTTGGGDDGRTTGDRGGGAGGGGSAAPVPGAGVGLLGMRERAEATGGTLAAEARPGGGFAVRATWPGPGRRRA